MSTITTTNKTGPTKTLIKLFSNDFGVLPLILTAYLKISFICYQRSTGGLFSSIACFSSCSGTLHKGEEFFFFLLTLCKKIKLSHHFNTHKSKTSTHKFNICSFNLLKERKAFLKKLHQTYLHTLPPNSRYDHKLS